MPLEGGAKGWLLVFLAHGERLLRLVLQAFFPRGRGKAEATLEVERTLKAGAALLEPKLNAHGFTFDITASGASSGGSFAEGRFRSGDRELWLSFRNSLGLVRYRMGDVELTHEQYMRALGLRSVARYPGFSSEPLAAFADLLSDLDHCDAFLKGNGSAFLEIAANYSEPASGFGRLSHE